MDGQFILKYHISCIIDSGRALFGDVKMHNCWRKTFVMMAYTLEGLDVQLIPFENAQPLCHLYFDLHIYDTSL